MSESARAAALAVALLALYLAASLARPVLPVDETRYLAVAWEMWQRGDLLVPTLSGEPYSHKPPLLFWLVHAGWAAAGVSSWWPRTLVALFALGSLGLLRPLTRELFPERTEAAGWAPLVLATSWPWAYFSSAIMFDLVLSFFVLLGALGLVRAWRRGGASAWAVYAVALGGGLLTKGPVVLLHLLPVAVLAPLWGRGAGTLGWAWYGRLLLGTLGGAAVALAWAVPAGIAGGEAYRNAILWGQTAGRLSESFAHREPWWFYLAALPVLTLPWWGWPALWRGARGTPFREAGVRFVLVQGASALLALSLVSGKQEQYLLPEVAVLAALGGRMLAGRREPGGGRRGVEGFALTSGVAFAVLAVAAVPVLGPAFDLGAVSSTLRSLEAQGVPLANEGKYHGQFHFLGRLQRPLEVVREDQIPDWLAGHPSGRVVVYFRGESYTGPGRVEYVQPYRGQNLAVVAAP